VAKLNITVETTDGEIVVKGPPALLLQLLGALLQEEDIPVQDELSRLRTQLAGCLLAAEGQLANRAVRGDYGWSPAYEAVAQLRMRHDELLKEKAGK
jgi:ATP-dependent exoDNAse (exonuclease V) alpha subunit